MAHFRESNATHLEVLEQAPGVGVPIEVDIYDGASPGTMLEHLEGAEGVQFTMTLNEVGAGQFRLNRHDPKALPAIVDRENLAKIKIGGVYRFAFWMQERAVETLDEQGEEGGEYWIIGGPEAAEYCDRAVWAPVTYAGGGSFLDEETGRWSFVNEQAGDIMARALLEARGRSPDPLEFLTDDFGSLTDSQGNAWPKAATLDIEAGTGYLATLKMLSALGLCDWRVRHDLRLSMYVELGRHFEVDGGTGEIVWRAGQNVTTKLRKRVEGGAVKSRVWVKGTGDAFFEVLRPDLEADPYIRRRETALSFSNSADPTTIQAAGEADLLARAAQKDAIAFGGEHRAERGGYEPFVDYDLGDWMTLDEPGVYDLATFRLVGMTIVQEEDDFSVSLEANSIEYEALLKIERQMNGAASGAGGGGGGSTNLSSGGGTGGGAATDTKVAVESGDKASFLYSKLLAGDGIAVSIAGTAGDRQARIDAALELVDLLDVDPTGLDEDDVFAWDATAGLFVPRPRGAGGGGGGGGGALLFPIDAAPSSPHAKDDEFSAAALDAKWTPGANAIVTTLAEGWLELRADIASRHAYFIRQLAPAGDFTITAKIASRLPWTPTDHRPGIFVAHTGSSRALVAGIGLSGGPAQAMWIEHSNYSEVANWGGYNGSWSGNVGVAYFGGSLYFRIRSVGGTLTVEFSASGGGWRQVGGTRAWAVQPDRIGLVLENNSGNMQTTEGLLVDWFRVTEP